MFKFIKTILKIIEGLLWFYLPVVMFYWCLILLNLEALEPIKALIGIIIEPFVSIINEFGEFYTVIEGSEIDYTVAILAGIVLGLAISIFYFCKLLKMFEKKLSDIKTNIMVEKQQKIKEEQKLLHIEELDRNKVVYIMLKVMKDNIHENYLTKDNDDSFSNGLLETYESSIKNIASRFAGKGLNIDEFGPDTTIYMFSDLEQLIMYLKHLEAKIIEINKGTSDLNKVFKYSIAGTCSYDQSTAKTDLYQAQKIINLAKANEVFVTSVLKEKIEIADIDLDIKFESKGMYILDEKQCDLYKLNVS